LKKKTIFDKYYSKKVKEHFLNPKNVGTIKKPDCMSVSKALCGDIMEIYLKIKDDKITDVKFETTGCSMSVASGSVLTEKIKGKTLEEAVKIKEKDLIKELGGVPDFKMHCIKNALSALRNAIADYKRKNK
jgi:nitrogen fixation NifU-like protein